NAKSRFLNDEKEFLKELKASGLRLVCITDHMKSGFACRLAQAALADGKILVLPGMEVNCVIPPSTERIHLLVVFPPEFDTSQIERIFSWHAGFPSERSRNGSEDFKLTKQLREWREEIERQGGMLLFAHIDESSRGHRAHYR